MQLSHQDRRSIFPRTLVSGKSVSFFCFLHLVHVFFIGCSILMLLPTPAKTNNLAQWHPPGGAMGRPSLKKYTNPLAKPSRSGHWEIDGKAAAGSLFC
jgi:hypothetical protein